jgi:hypothetical protein
MEFALIDGVRAEAQPGLKGHCPDCGAGMIAKCGPRVIHHWAHAGRKNCDPWWENETNWHREWKAYFPEECREVSHTAPDGEIHRSDIKTPTGIYIEVQHSAMTDEERLSREEFYGNLVWVIDAKPFAKSFDFCHYLPDPSTSFAQDLVWYPVRRGSPMDFGTFWRKSENPEAYSQPGSMVLIHSYHRNKDEILENWRGHQQYFWSRPRQTWLDATCPVYLDFGDEWLFRLEKYGNSALSCIYRVAKRKFLHDVMTETAATDIASRFYPVSTAV